MKISSRFLTFVLVHSETNNTEAPISVFHQNFIKSGKALEDTTDIMCN